MVGELIEREFGVMLSLSSVGRLLRRLGLSPQRPLFRAYQQDPEAVERWRREQYPTIRAEAEAAGAVIYFGDEASVRSDFHSGTTRRATRFWPTRIPWRRSAAVMRGAP